ncbi:MAG: heavy metal translocating P-type ATPase metal-binding domain-containing protein [Planctomycetota bacterium]
MSDVVTQLESISNQSTKPSADPSSDASDRKSQRTQHAGHCTHCDLELPSGDPFEGFCCPGCRTVHDLLQSQGLTRFYELGSGQPLGAVPQPASERVWLDEIDPETASQEWVTGPRPIRRARVAIQGLHCAACVWLMQEIWQRIDGAQRIDLNPGTGRAELWFEEGRTVLTQFADQIEGLGYRLRPADGSNSPKDSTGSALALRFGICAALSMNAMTFAFAQHFGLDQGDDLSPMFRTLSMVLGTLAVLVGGPVFFRPAFAGLRRGFLHLDLPISLGLVLAYGGSLVLWLTGEPGTYFDTVTIFVTLMLGGRLVQRRAVQRHRDSLLRGDLLAQLQARRIRENRIERVSARDLHKGDRILLAAGELLTVEATAIDPAGAPFSLDWIHGESRPRHFQAGEVIPAGAFHRGDHQVELRTLAEGADSEVLELVSSEPESAERRTKRSFQDRLGRVYASIVLLLAVGTAALWLLADPSKALSSTVAVLVVTCPCAIGLALPLAFEAATARLRRRGILALRHDLFDRALRVRKIVFDKTGTLTWGGVRANLISECPEELRSVLFTMASSSGHPVAHAVQNALRGLPDVEFDPRVKSREVVGHGVEAIVGMTKYRLGSEGFAFGDARDRTGDFCLFTRDGHAEAVFAIEEDLRPGAKEEVTSLKEHGFRVELLSGDRDARVQHFGAQLGLEANEIFGSRTATEKGDHVELLDNRDTLVVGDGLNDARAFDAAYLAGTPALDRPVLPGRADFVYSGVGTGAVTEILRTARLHRQAVVRTLWTAGLYNLGATAVAIAGFASPLACAIAMPTGSVLTLAVTAWSLREHSDSTNLRTQRTGAGTRRKEAIA